LTTLAGFSPTYPQAQQQTENDLEGYSLLKFSRTLV
jgi:hypothetical protein